MALGTLLRLVDLMNLILLWFVFSVPTISYSFYRVHLIFKGENPTYVKQHFYIGFYSGIYRLISFKLGVMIEITKLYIFILVWMTLTFIQGHSYIRNQKLWCPFSHKFKYIFVWNSVCFHNLLVCWFVEAHTKFVLHKLYSSERILLMWFHEIYI